MSEAPALAPGITDDLDTLLGTLPAHIRDAVRRQSDNSALLEIVIDLGRPPTARYPDREIRLDENEISSPDINTVVHNLGDFGGDNRAGIARTLHRISCIRNRRGDIVGLTMRVGRAVYGSVAVIEDLVMSGQSLLLLGRPGVGKTTLLREVARVLSERDKRVVIVDTSNEIGGDGDIPHPGIGRARRMQVPTPAMQHAVMVEAVENHMPEVIIIDEIGTELEAQAARTIAERGVQLVATAHGNTLANLMMNPTLSDLIGGIQTVTLSDEEARRRGTRKSVLERKAPPTFDALVEIQSFTRVSIHRDVARTVDALLRGDAVRPSVREMDDEGTVHAADGESARTALAYPETHDEYEFEQPPGRMPPAPGPHRRIYPFGVSPTRLAEAIRETGANASIVNRVEDADVVMTLRSIFRRRSGPIRDAESRSLPIFVLKHNTVLQMEQSLRAASR
ncbi:MAG: AAA family ATPase, partial [Dehalococcoidia bacterium]